MKAQGEGSSAIPHHVSKKRKHTSDVQSSDKGASGSSIRPKTREVVPDALRHKVKKGLMTSQGPVAPPPLPLLVKDRDYAMDTTRSIVQDADLDKCSEHKTEASIKCLKDHLES